METRTIRSHGMLHGVKQKVCTYLEKHLSMSPQDSPFICKKHLVEARRHGHKYDHVPSWKTSPSSAREFSKQQCSNPQYNNVEYDKLIKPFLSQMTSLMNYLEQNTQVAHLFFAENAIMTHMPQYMVLAVFHAAHVELTLRKERPLAGIVLMPKRCHNIYQTRPGKL